MVVKKTNQTTKRKQNVIFISWSGEISKKIALELKEVLENKIFVGTGLKCFVSTVDIASGDDWWNKIKTELKKCKQGILCVTKENIRAPWLFYEAGAMVARDVPTIPLLFNCNIKILENSPIKGRQCVDFYDLQKFIKMIYDINTNMKLLEIDKTQLSVIAKAGHEELAKRLVDTLRQLKNMRIFNEKYIFPSNITTVKIKTLYMSAPMSSIDDDEYNELREELLSLKEVLEKIGFSEIISPILDKDSPKKFDGKTKAINENFVSLKQIDSMIIIYPKAIPTSVLVEIGYGIALCKKMVIFYQEMLPYILEEAGGTIPHVKTYKYKNFSDISQIIKSNGMAIFKGENDE